MNLAARLLSAVGLSRGAPAADAPPASQAQTVRVVRATNLYDAAATNDRNARHWSSAQSYAPNAAAGPWQRRVIRDRARYEAANNSYLAGILNTLADDTVGTGPRLQLQTGDDEVDSQVEEAFGAWAQAVKLGEQLHLMRIAKARDGEAIAVMKNNPRSAHPVKLDLWLVEPEQVVDERVTVSGVGFAGMDAEGVELDDFGNPRAYWILREHPNAIGSTVFEPPTRVPAEQVLHYFKPLRAGQWRGVSEAHPALPLFALLRRYTLATVSAAENAANVAMVFESSAMGDPEEHNQDAGDVLELQAGGVPFLPAGYKLNGFKAEQPTSTYPDFKREILNEAARCFSMPYNVAAADSSSYNYSSGRLDHKTYFKSIRGEQTRIQSVVLEPLLAAFLREAVLVEGLFSPDVRSKVGREGFSPKHSWFWDGFEHIDPVKDATADDIRLKNGSATLADIYGKTGDDWQRKVEQRAKERQFIEKMEAKYGVSLRDDASSSANSPDATNAPDAPEEPPANPRRAPARRGAPAPRRSAA